MRIHILLLSLMMSFTVSAANTSTIQKLVLEHDWLNFLQGKHLAPDPHCRPDGTQCVDTICGVLSSFECDEQQELFEVVRACRGNFGAECFREATSHLSRFEYDTRQEAIQIAVACTGVVDGSCIRYICGRMSRFECDDLEEIVNVARQCGRYNP